MVHGGGGGIYTFNSYLELLVIVKASVESYWGKKAKFYSKLREHKEAPVDYLRCHKARLGED